MFRFSTGNMKLLPRFPRVCGDVPQPGHAPEAILEFSPRMRGCSDKGLTGGLLYRVFPAYAGMFLPVRGGEVSTTRFPRVCGDVPFAENVNFSSHEFSPRMRGCSAGKTRPCNAVKVFPAYAGLFPPRWSPGWTNTCFPRVCGDVPFSSRKFRLLRLFSPRMRGCSEGVPVVGWVGGVFPAYAGMFRPSNFRRPQWIRFPRVCGDVPYLPR